MEERLGTLEDPVQGVVTENSTFLNDYAKGLTGTDEDFEALGPPPKKTAPAPVKQTVGDRLKSAVAEGVKKATPVEPASTEPAPELTGGDEDFETLGPPPKKAKEPTTPAMRRQKNKPPAEEDENSWLGNIARGVGSRVTGMTGGMLQSAYLKGEAVQDAISKMAQKTGIGELHWDEDGLSWRTSTDEEIDAPSMVGGLLKAGADYLHDTDFGYKQGTTIDDVLSTPLTSVIPFAVEQGLVSLPDMMLIATGYGIPIYIDAHAGEIAVERAKNDNRPEPTLKDYFAALPGSAISAGLERFGLGKMLHGVGDVAIKTGKDVLKQVLKVGGIEAGTEGAEELAEYGSESIGTEKGFDPVEAGKRTLGGVVAGGPMGGTVRLVTATAETQSDRNKSAGTLYRQAEIERQTRAAAGQSTPVSPQPVPPAALPTQPPNPQTGSGTNTPPAQPGSPPAGNTNNQPSPTGTPNPPGQPVTGPKTPAQDYGKQPSAGPATTQVTQNTGVAADHAAALTGDLEDEEAPAAGAAPGTPPISREVLQHTLDSRANLDPQQRRSIEKTLARMNAEAQAQETTVKPPSSTVQPGPAATDVGDVAAPAPTPAPQPIPGQTVTQPKYTPEQLAKIDADNAAAKATLDAFPAGMEDYLARREAEQAPAPVAETPAVVEQSPIEKKMAAAAARKAEIQAAMPAAEAPKPAAPKAPKAVKAKAVSKAKAAPAAPAKEVHQERRAEANEQDEADEKQAAAEEAVLSRPGRKRTKGEVAQVKSRVRSAMTWGSPEGVPPADLNAAIREETEAVLADPKFIKSQPDSVASEVKKRVKERFAKKPAETPAKTTEKPKEKQEAPKPTTEAPKAEATPEPAAAPKAELIKKDDTAAPAEKKSTRYDQLTEGMDAETLSLVDEVGLNVTQKFLDEKDVRADQVLGFAPTVSEVAALVVKNAKGRLEGKSGPELAAEVRRISDTAFSGVNHVLGQQIATEKAAAEEADRKAILASVERKKEEAQRKAERIAENNARRKDRRGRDKEDDADTMASRDRRTIIKQARKEMDRYESVRDQRMLRIKEIDAEIQADKTADHTERNAEIDRLIAERVEAKRAEEAEAKGKEDAEVQERLANVGKPAPEPKETRSTKLKKKRSQVVADERKSQIAAVLADTAGTRPLTEADYRRPDWHEKLRDYFKRVIARSPNVGDKLNPLRSLEENMIILMKRMGRGETDKLNDFVLAEEYLKESRSSNQEVADNARQEFFSSFVDDTDKTIDRNADVEKQEDTSEEDQGEQEAELTDEELEQSLADMDLNKRLAHTAPQSFRTITGDTVTKAKGQVMRVLGKSSSRASLNGLVKDVNAKGIRGILLRMHARQLNKMVGDVPVIISPNEDMGEAAGNFSYIKDPNHPGGMRPVIFIAEWVGASREAQMILLLHEMTHAATSQQIVLNNRGVRTMLDRMIKELEKIPAFKGHYGLTDAQELVAESYTDQEFRQLLRNTPIPDDIKGDISTLLRNTPIRSFWDMLVRITEHAIGKIYPMRSRDNFLGSIMALDPLLSYSTEEQEAVWRPEVSSAVDAAKMMDHVKDTLNNARIFAEGGVGPTARTITTYLKTLDAIARESAEFFGGENNALQKLINMGMAISGKVRLMQKAGVKLALKVKRAERANKAAFDAMNGVLNDANDMQIDATDLDDNSHISPTGQRDEGRRHHRPLLRARFDALPQEYKDLYKEVVGIHKTQHDRGIALTVRNVIDSYISKYNITLPPGEDLHTLTQWALSSAIDNTGTNMTPRDTAISTALGTVVDHLRNVKSFRKLKGNYIPKVRFGKWYFSARHKVAVPTGATLDPNAPDQNVLVFDLGPPGDETKYLYDWEHTTQETYHQPKVRWIDPLTGATTTKQAMYVDPATGQLVIPEKRFVVEVQNKTVIMNDRRWALDREYRKFQNNPNYTLRDIREVDHDTAGLNSEMSPAVQSLIRHIDQSMGANNVGKQAIINAIREAEIRQMSSSSAMKRNLKRKNVLGYSEDLARTLMSTTRSKASMLVSLEMAGELAKADTEVEKYINAHANDGKSFRRETMAREVGSRIKSQGIRNVDGFGQAALDNISKIVNMVYLASPAYYVINALQPIAVTLPVVGGKYGWGRTSRHMFRISREMGLATNVAQGVVETGKALKNLAPPNKYTERYIPEQSFGERMLDRMTRKGVTDVGHLRTLWETLEERGAGSEGGHEVNAASAIGTEGITGYMSQYLDQANDVTRVMSESIETANRFTVAIPVFRMEIENGASVEDAMRMAISYTEMTQGNYSDINNPTFLSGNLRPLFSFKRYATMIGNLVYNAVGGLFKKGQRAQSAKVLVGMAATTIAFAGTTGLPYMEWGMGFMLAANLLGLADSSWEDKEIAIQEFYEKTLNNFFSKDTSEMLAEMLNRGFTRGIGIDTSNRMGNSSLVLFGEPKSYDEQDLKEYVLKNFGGAALNTVFDVYSAFEGDDVDWEKMPFPKVVRDVLKGYRGATKGTVNRRGRQVAPEWSVGDAVKQGLGFGSAEQAHQWEGGSGTKNKTKQKEHSRRTQLLEDLNNAKDAGAKERVRSTIREWNRSHHDKALKISRDTILKSRNRRKQLDREMRREYAQ